MIGRHTFATSNHGSGGIQKFDARSTHCFSGRRPNPGCCSTTNSPRIPTKVLSQLVRCVYSRGYSSCARSGQLSEGQCGPGKADGGWGEYVPASNP